jgi:hypothetical protein
MSAIKALGRGRGRPPKSRPAMDPVLRAALMEQDNEQVEKENSCVLSLITSQDKHLDFYEDDDEDDTTYESTQVRSALSDSVNQSYSSSQPAKSTGKASAKPSQSKAKPLATSGPVKRLKAPLNAAELTKQNYELFTRSLESKCNNQFELLNENFRAYTRTQAESTTSIVSILNKINSTLSNQVYNTPTAHVKTEKKRSCAGLKVETICLESSPSQSSNTSSCSTSSSLPSLSQPHRNAMKPYTTPITQLGYHPSTFTVPHFYRGFDNSEAPSQFDQYQPPLQPYQPPPPQPSQPPPPPPRPQTFVPQVTSTQPLSHPHVPDYNALMDVAAKKPSNNALARECFKIIFASEIRDNMFATGLYNVYGRTMRGSTDRKFPLDSAKVHALRCFVEDKFQHGCNKEEEWSKCVDALHRYIGELKRV